MFATLYLSNFYLQAALRHETELAGRPVALIDDQEPKPVFIQLNAEAESAGVRRGMTPSQGLARHLALVVKSRLRAQEDSLAALLLQFGFTLTPFVEATAPGICTLQFKNCRALFSKIERAVEQLHAFGLQVQAGIAPTPDTSFLAAHLARPVLQVDDSNDFLAPLPLETLMVG